jgi:hypothetical protein
VVPQIWLTYDELAALMDCNPAAARSVAAAVPLARRRSRDGRTRAKLNGALTEIFLERMSRGWFDRDPADDSIAGDAAADSTADAGKLWAILDQMARPSAKALPAPPRRPDEIWASRRGALPSR